MLQNGAVLAEGTFESLMLSGASFGELYQNKAVNTII